MFKMFQILTGKNTEQCQFVPNDPFFDIEQNAMDIFESGNYYYCYFYYYSFFIIIFH